MMLGEWGIVVYAVNFRRLSKKRLADKRKRRGCFYCGRYDDLEFHHLHDKVATIGTMVLLDKYSIALLQDELDKCIVLCHRCHVRTHQTAKKVIL
jgi:hypothetical protein